MKKMNLLALTVLTLSSGYVVAAEEVAAEVATTQEVQPEVVKATADATEAAPAEVKEEKTEVVA
jgi:hypothetical protein